MKPKSFVNLRESDWKHRLHVLQAWRTWSSGPRAESANDRLPDEIRGATYRATLEGCAITVRALCDLLGVACNFRNKTISDGPARLSELFNKGFEKGKGRDKVECLPDDKPRCLLEVLYLANRATAHPENGNLDHKVSHAEMTSAINTLLDWLDATPPPFPELAKVERSYLNRIN
jgi:hypothetical protein